MNLVTYRPTEASLFGFDGLWDRMVDNYFTDGLEGWNAPAVDVREDGDHYLLEMDLPGRTEKDLEVEVKENVLTVSSSKEEKKEEKKNGYLLRERRESSFCRSFRLPEGADAGKIEAAFKNGVLELRIPKAPEAKPRKIQIAANN
jgi:HSP20 family protein